MTKENAQIIIAKQKKKIRFICYISLFFLVILLFLPPALRILVKEEEPEVVKIVTVLTCNKTNESISSTFLNDVPQNILYKITGNYLVNNNSDILETNNADEITSNQNEVGVVADNQNNALGEGSFLELIKPISQISYDDVNNISSFRVNMTSLKELVNYQNDFNTIAAQETYFASLNFTCTKENK